MSISFDGIGETAATFLTEEGADVKPGDVVCLTGDGEVGLGESGDALCGVVLSVAGDGCTGVQIDGLARVRYSGTAAPGTGWRALCADGSGGVAAAGGGNAGRTYLVVSVDEIEKTAVIKL